MFNLIFSLLTVINLGFIFYNLFHYKQITAINEEIIKEVKNGEPVPFRFNHFFRTTFWILWFVMAGFQSSWILFLAFTLLGFTVAYITNVYRDINKYLPIIGGLMCKLLAIITVLYW